MDSFEWNKIFGGLLAGLLAVLCVSIVSDMMFARHLPEKPGYEVAGVEEGPAEGAPAAEAEKPAAFYLASADVAKGEAVFKKCAACHNVDPGGANGTGPALHGVVGRGIAAAPGFGYSDALAGMKGKSWDWDALWGWLKSPKAYAAGNKMSFAGIAKPEDRAAVIAYLNSKSASPLPLPAAPAEEAAPAAEEAPAAEAAAPADAAAK
ncbi:c-type cytochrome [Sandarakinorhabdus cyanobacteriorum]|uniref:c-type cytochrome n=1 Tax=Sandarakinorhabdus cyanobacteriorum TaxID=1981098 RepID=UPI001FAEB538|nr:cytochrome c family protein [Sandarakinorhabdus cyanobacteriorum]